MAKKYSAKKIGKLFMEGVLDTVKAPDTMLAVGAVGIRKGIVENDIRKGIEGAAYAALGLGVLGGVIKIVTYTVEKRIEEVEEVEAYALEKFGETIEGD